LRLLRGLTAFDSAQASPERSRGASFDNRAREQQGTDK
jgi:hypothetical protein